MAGCFISAVACLPQRGLISESSGRIYAMINHSVAARALGGILCGGFWWTVAQRVACSCSMCLVSGSFTKGVVYSPFM